MSKKIDRFHSVTTSYVCYLSCFFQFLRETSKKHSHHSLFSYVLLFAVAICPAAWKGLKKTKCPAVRHFYRFKRKCFDLAFRKCSSIFVRICHAIGKRRVASQLTGLALPGIRIKLPHCDT